VVLRSLQMCCDNVTTYNSRIRLPLQLLCRLLPYTPISFFESSNRILIYLIKICLVTLFLKKSCDFFAGYLERLLVCIRNSNLYDWIEACHMNVRIGITVVSHQCDLECLNF
jgi:hypothetical protein